MQSKRASTSAAMRLLVGTSNASLGEPEPQQDAQSVTGWPIELQKMAVLSVHTLPKQLLESHVFHSQSGSLLTQNRTATHMSCLCSICILQSKMCFIFFRLLLRNTSRCTSRVCTTLFIPRRGARDGSAPCIYSASTALGLMVSLPEARQKGHSA